MTEREMIEKGIEDARLALQCYCSADGFTPPGELEQVGVKLKEAWFWLAEYNRLKAERYYEPEREG